MKVAAKSSKATLKGGKKSASTEKVSKTSKKVTEPIANVKAKTEKSSKSKIPPVVDVKKTPSKKKAAVPAEELPEEEEEEDYYSSEEESIDFEDVLDEEDLDDDVVDADDFEVKAEKFRAQMAAQAEMAEAERQDDQTRQDRSGLLKGVEEGGEGAEDSEQVQLLAQSHSAEELRERIQETVQVLSHFKEEREEERDRTEYLDLLRRDLIDLYEYNEFLMDAILYMFPPAEAVEFLEAMEKTRPTTIRVNTLKTKRRDLVQMLVKRGMNIEPLEKWSKVGLQVFESNVPIAGTVEYLAGYYMLQAAASFLPVMALAPQEKERVLDLAAAPGGKTTYIAQLMKNSGVLFANDVSESRCKSLNANIQRLGVKNCIVTNYDGTGYEKVMRNFDRVLLDAPCTGTGIISRDKSIKTSKHYEDIQRATQLQRSLILSAIDACAVGGYVVYSTCSFLVEEDEAIVAYALTKRDVEIVEMGLPFGRPGFTKYRHLRYPDALMHSRRYFPHVHNMDGFYVCKLKKKSNNVKSSTDESSTATRSKHPRSSSNGPSSKPGEEQNTTKKLKKEVSQANESPKTRAKLSIPPPVKKVSPKEKKKH